MNEIRFEWDPEKAKLNAEKHGVTFEEAESVFYDEQAIQFYEEDSVIRIISARKATQAESRHYWS